MADGAAVQWFLVGLTVGATIGTLGLLLFVAGMMHVFGLDEAAPSDLHGPEGVPHTERRDV